MKGEGLHKLSFEERRDELTVARVRAYVAALRDADRQSP